MLLAAIIFPVVTRAREAGYRAESIAHLRQVGMGIEMYRGDHDGRLPFAHLDPFVQTGHLHDVRLLRSHLDDFDDGYGYAISQCIDTWGPTSVQTSYETSLLSKGFYDRLKTIDPDAAIVVDRTHGDVLDWADTSCERSQYYYSGRILRLYEDTSVRVGQFSVIDWKASPDIGLAWHRIKLFTDKDES
jgi:hypothetical protein